MRYEDSSQSGTFSSENQGQDPVARDDMDTLAAGARTPALGNVITGEGTQFGAASSDLSAADSQVTAIAGADGQDSNFSGGKLQVGGEFGKLSIDAAGNYSYLANRDAPENSRDLFTYTLADKQGNSDTATLTIEIGKTPVVIQANAQQVVVGPDGVVVLPAGVELSDIHVVGRNLVIDLPDGSQMIIIDGAVFVPQLVLGTVEVPATNLAALLIDSEPRPAAGGQPPSSGGNFGLPPGPLDPGVPLGDLLPPTEMVYTPPDVREVNGILDRKPEISIDPGNGVPVANAVDSVNEAGLPARNEGEPQGSGEEAAAGANGDPSETTTGTIVYTSPDNPNTITIDGLGLGGPVVITAIGQVIQGQYGTLTITSIANGAIGYSYTLGDNTSGNNTSDPFTVVITDNDGDTDTATLTINIVDDVPTARPDTDSIAAGQYGPATGNVITDASAGDAGDSDTNAADTVGADNASLTLVSGAGGSDSTFDGSGNLVVNGQYGVLTIKADGSYSYVRNAGTPGGVNDVFNYTLTDGDGDTSSSTLTISIGDETPRTGQNPTALLDDDALAGGNPGGVGDDADAANLSGTLGASGGDGPLTYDLLLTGAPAGFSYVDGPAGAVHVMQGTTHVLTITVNSATGAYTVSQINPIDHPAGSDENNVAFTINYRVTDQDGDTADGTLDINVDDDTPTIGRADVSTPTLTVDETNLTVNASASFAGVFQTSYGADGAGTIGYAVSVVNGTDSGLIDVATGQSIFLFNNAGVVEGRVGGVGGAVAFSVSVNATTGVVTLDQVRALDHPSNPNPDDAVSPDAGSIQLTATITDGDGDPASLTINIGGQLSFEDDGPSVNPVLNANATVTVDESLPSTAPAINTGVIVKGDDPDLAGGFALGQANSGVAIVTANAAFGADGPAVSGSLTYALTLGLNDTPLTLTDGSTITLQLVGGVIVGVVDNGPFAGQAAFAIAIDPATGVVSVEQYLSLDHPSNPNPNDPLGLGANTVGVTVTATDGDGDPVTSAAVDISGQITLLDDGPSAVADVDSIASGQYGPATGNVLTGVDIPGGDANGSDGSADAPGADGGAVSQIQSVNVPANIDTTSTGGNFVVNGQYGVLTINVDGSYSYARNAGTPGGVNDVFTYTLTDGDGDPTTATLTINIGDATPITTPNLTALLDDDALAGGNPGGVGDDADAANLSGTLGASGGDGPLTYDLLLTGAPAGFSYVDGPAGAVHVMQGTTHVLTITVNSATGAYTVSQINPIDHPAGSDENNVAFTINYRVTDQDGDTADGTLDINVDDDTPTIGRADVSTPTLTVDETNLTVNASASFAGVFQTSYGADGAGTIGYAVSVVNGTDSGLIDVATGQSIFLFNNAGVVEGRVGGVGGAVAFSVSVNATTGVVTLDQVRALDHPSNPNPDDAVSPDAGSIQLTATITDGDGDPASLTINIGGQLSFEDDGPSVNPVLNANATVTVDESLPSTAPAINTGVIVKGDDPDLAGGFALGQANSGVAIVTANAAFGADGPAVSGSLTYALTVTNVSSGVTLTDGTAINLQNVGGVIVGVVAAGAFAGQAAFAISIDPATGVVTVEQYLSLDHPTNPDQNEALFLGAGSVGVTVTATDGDGDPVTSAAVDISGQISFLDDGPSAVNDTDVIVGGNGPATGNVITGVDFVGGDANGTDGSADAPGADGGSITRIASNNVPANVDTTFAAGNLVVAGQYGVLTIKANGDYSYLRNDGTPGGVNDVFTYTLTDGDGDSVTATLTIGIDDNFPQAGSVNVQLDDETLAGGIAGGTGDVSPNLVNVSGNLPGSGGDGALTFDLLLTGAPGGFSYVDGPAGAVHVFQGTTHVVTITVNVATGAYTVTQIAPIVHPAGLNENNVQFTVNYRVTDADGDFADGTINVDVDDDTPTIDVTAGADAAVILTTDDPQTIAGATDTAVSTANFGGVFGLTQSVGADGGAAATLSYALDVTGFTGGPAGVDSGLDQGGNTIFLYEIGGKVVGSTSATLAGVVAGNTVFDVGVSGTGVVTLTQYSQIDHPIGSDPSATGSPFNDHIVSLTDTLVTLTASSTLTDNDGDQVTDSATVNIGANLRFTDDGPSATIVETGQTVSVDESVGIQVDSNDTTNAGVIALFAGVTNTGTDTHLPQYAQNASAIVGSTGSVYGADGAGTTAFSLNVSAAGVDSGLDTTAGQSILLFKEGALIVGRVSGGADDGKAAFAIAIDPVTGVVSMVEYLSINHPNAANPDDSVSIADGAILAVVTVTDFDGDTATQQVGIGSAIQFQDSAPIMTAAQNMNIQNSGDVAHTAAFAFNLGADGAATNNNVITNVTGTATVNGNPVTLNLVAGAEDANTASYTFSFDYSTGTGTVTATGTLVFNKVAGTYTVDFANPIQGVTTILQTAQGTLFQGYEFGTSTPDGSQPAISVTQIQDLAGTANDIYVQFTSVTEPSSGTGDNNLEVTNWVPGTDNPPPVAAGGDTAWDAGQLFNQVDGWVSTSGSANGVDGDTIQGGEVLDFTLVQGANPTGVLAQPATFAQASAMFLKFDGIGTGEDMIVILKLYDPTTNTYTTRAIMIENGDIQKGPGSGPGQYSGITLDNNDGLVIIESNDYNAPGENWVIVGAQIAGSDEGVTGTAIDLNPAIGPGGDSDVDNNGSLDTDALGFQSDTNDGPFKISSIGFLTTSTTPQNVQLDFNVTVTDGDGDSITQAISATVTAAADSVSAATIPAANTTINSALPPEPVGTESSSSSSSFSFSNDNPKWNGNSNGNSQNFGTTGIVAGIVAASGLMAMPTAAETIDFESFDLSAVSLNQGFTQQMVERFAVEDFGDLNLALTNELREPAFDLGELASSSVGFDNFTSSSLSLTDLPLGSAAQDLGTALAIDQGPMFDFATAATLAPMVGMPGAEALMAAGLTGDNVQRGGSVEQILADALGGHGGAATVDALLQALPGQEFGGNAGIDSLASPIADHVPAWDMGSSGAFASTIDMMFRMDASMLHQDAVQPVVNG